MSRLVRQRGFGRCGEAALATVAAHHGRAGVALPRSASLADLVDGAERCGLTATAVRAGPSTLTALPLPLIAHLDGHHWVVVTEAGEAQVTVHDPERGRASLPAAEFARRWDGYAVCFG